MKSTQKVFVKKSCHSRGMLSGIFLIPSRRRELIKANTLCYNNPEAGVPRQKPSGMTANWIAAHGFTLIELLVVVLIIGILAAVALPQYQKAVLKSQLTQMQVYMDALRKGADVYYLANGDYPTDVRDIDIDIAGGAEIKTSNIASGYNGVFFENGVECVSLRHATACMGPDFYLLRKNPHTQITEAKDWPEGLACQGLNKRADEICEALDVGGVAEPYSTSEHTAYIIGN